MSKSKEEKQRRRVFLSHVAADRDAARKLRDALDRHSDARVFTAEMLSAGGNWQAELKNELAESDLFFVLLSPKALESNLVLQEIGAAWALDKPIVLVSTSQHALPKIPIHEFAAHYIATLEDLDDPDVVRQVLELDDEATEHDTTAH